MKNYFLALLFVVSGVAQGQHLWEVNPKTITNEIGRTDTVKYISGKVIFANIADGPNSNFEFYIAFHSPNGAILRARNFSQSSYTQNLTDAGMNAQQAASQAEYVWTTTIPALVGTNATAKRNAIVALLDLYGYTLKE